MKEQEDEKYYVEHRTATQRLAWEGFGEALVQGVIPTIAHARVTYGSIHSLSLGDDARFEREMASLQGKPFPIRERTIIFSFDGKNHACEIYLWQMRQRNQNGDVIRTWWQKVHCAVTDFTSSRCFQFYFNTNKAEGPAVWVGAVDWSK